MKRNPRERNEKESSRKFSFDSSKQQDVKTSLFRNKSPEKYHRKKVAVVSNFSEHGNL